MPGARQLSLDIQGKGAVDVDVIEEGRGEVGDLVIGDDVAVGRKGYQGIVEVHRVEQHHCVDNDGEAEGGRG